MQTATMQSAYNFKGSRCESFASRACYAASNLFSIHKRHTFVVCLFVLLAALVLNLAVILLVVLLSLIVIIMKRICF